MQTIRPVRHPAKRADDNTKRGKQKRTQKKGSVAPPGKFLKHIAHIFTGGTQGQHNME